MGLSSLSGAVEVLALLCLVVTTPSLAWTQEELDLFDLVEEIGLGTNFYDLMDISQDASSADVRRAYRQLSLQLHPDKSDSPEAAENFRKMVAVSDVLKDEEKRKMYDHILIEGLPDWQQPLFYYRRMRKMGLVELCVLLLGMASVAHYVYGWAVFAEKQILLQDVLSKKEKKGQRKSRHGKQTRLEAEVELLTTQAQASIPHFKDLLPVILAKGLIRLMLLGWHFLMVKLKTSTSSIVPQDEDEEEEDVGDKHQKRMKSWMDSSKKPVDKENERNKCQKESNFFEMRSRLDLVMKGDDNTRGGESKATNSTGKQLGAVFVPKFKKPDTLSQSDLAVATESNYPHVEESQDETVAAGLMGSGNSGAAKDRPGLLPASDGTKCVYSSQTMGGTEDQETENTTVLNHRKISSGESKRDIGEKSTGKCHGRGKPGNKETDGCLSEKTSSQDLSSILEENECETGLQSSVQILASADSSLQEWNQFQQIQLEWALTQYPKFSKDRWLNVSRSVPGKSQEECIGRCKQIYQEIKRKIIT